jgi:hypothetical protein
MTDKTISIPIYDAQLHVAICDTYEDFEEKVLETGYSDDLAGAGMITLCHTETTLFHIIMNKDDISYGNVAHECLHVTNKLMHHVGIVYDRFNDEAMCYLHGFIVDCVHKIINDDNTN